MKRTLTLLVIVPLMLAACSNAPSAGEDLSQKLENPLYARQYYGEMMDFMVSLVIRNDPQAMSGATAQLIDEARVDSFERARAASNKEREGPRGSFASPLGEVTGDVVILDNTLFIGPNFDASPGLDLRMMLTKSSPRTETFPDDTTVELGALKDAFGAQRYSIPPEAKDLRIVALWDAKLGRLLGHAQLSE